MFCIGHRLDEDSVISDRLSRNWPIISAMDYVSI